MVRPFAALVCAVALGAAWPEGAGATTVRVESQAAFARAVQALRSRGGTIVLRPGRYELLWVGPRRGPPLVVRGERGASIRCLELHGARNVRLRNLRIRSRRSEARLLISHSRNVIVERVRVGGRALVPAWVKLLNSHRVTIRRSELTGCGERVACVLTGRTSRLRLVGNHFHDCRGCDFVRGRFGPRMLIRGNRFDRALRGPCGSDPAVCNHQDHIELQGGRGLVVEGNWFGLYQLPGAAQLYLVNSVHDVVIRNNVFLLRDPRVPGIASRVGINLDGTRAVPRNVLITHNTVLSGMRRKERDANGSVHLDRRYARLAVRLRPIVANNVMRLAREPDRLCRLTRRSEANVVLLGSPCSASDVVGDPRLDLHGRPTPASALVIDRGDGRWRTRFDILGRLRDARPDIGAYEFAAAPS